MSEPLLATSFENRAAKLLEMLRIRRNASRDNISYLAAKLLEVYNEGYDASILSKT